MKFSLRLITNLITKEAISAIFWGLVQLAVRAITMLVLGVVGLVILLLWLLSWILGG